jgi:hypothetical protein
MIICVIFLTGTSEYLKWINYSKILDLFYWLFNTNQKEEY